MRISNENNLSASKKREIFINSTHPVNILNTVKSKYVLYNIFEILYENKKLNIIYYNKKLKKDTKN